MGSAANNQRPYRQRSSPRQPRRLRHHEQTAGYNRVGVEKPNTESLPFICWEAFVEIVGDKHEFVEEII